MNPILEAIHHKLIVSVQAYPSEPLRRPDIMAAMALAAEQGGAAAIRCQGLADIAAIKGQVEVPVIGLWKEGRGRSVASSATTSQPAHTQASACRKVGVM